MAASPPDGSEQADRQCSICVFDLRQRLANDSHPMGCYCEAFALAGSVIEIDSQEGWEIEEFKQVRDKNCGRCIAIGVVRICAARAG
jgi:hypothetical protein